MNDAERRGATLYAKLINRLFVHGGSFRDLAAYSGLSEATVRRYVRCLRETKSPAANGRLRPMVRIFDWDFDCRGTPSIPVFKMDPGPDLKRPRLTDAERQRRYRANVKKRAFVGAPSVFHLATGMQNNVLVGRAEDQEDQGREASPSQC